MDNQDNLFNKIKSAAENAETKDFPSMEKVWSRIDAKLDAKVEKKYNNNFKKLLIAASVFIVATIGYQFFKSEKAIETPNNSIVTKAKVESILKDTLVEQNATVSSDIKNPDIKENAKAILEEQIAKPKSEAITEVEIATPKSKAISEVELVTIQTKDEVAKLQDVKGYDDNTVSSNDKKAVENNYESKSSSAFYEGKREAKTYEENKRMARSAKKLPPVVIVDGVVSKKEAADLKDDEDFETILELPNPIYYINGVLFTEEALLGPNPTSPYAPLKKQNIETTTVLSPEKAMKIYGEKGKNGVVIITTKNGKSNLKTRK